MKSILIPIGPLPNDSDLIRDLKLDNRETFIKIRNKLPLDYIINKNNLLLYKGKLYINYNTLLYTCLIQEAYNQVSSAYSSILKTYRLLKPKYY